MPKNTMKYLKGFHTSNDDELDYAIPNPAGWKKESKEVFIQEYDVSYQFHTYFHPYTSELTERLIREGTSGIQKTDTEYEPNGALLSGSVEVALVQEASLTINRGQPFALANDLHTKTIEGAKTDLESKLRMRFETDVNVKLAIAEKESLVIAILLNSLELNKKIGESFTIKDQNAYLKSRLGKGIKVILLDNNVKAIRGDGKDAGDVVLIPAQTELLIDAGTDIVLPEQQVTLTDKKRRPIDEFFDGDFFEDNYSPNPDVVTHPYPVKDLDFSSGGAYSAYNWELFFHIPITIAIHLSKNHRFAEAQHWFHYIFDPTDNSTDPEPDRFWKVRPFHSADIKNAEQILMNLATEQDAELLKDTINSIQKWKELPFRPHMIARYRHPAYMRKTLMAYLDNLIAWGDSLFRQDTGEAIDEAMILYVLAANILGPRPQPVPKKGSIRPQTYANLRRDLREFGAVMRELEASIGFDLFPLPTDENHKDDRQIATVRSLGQALYFCVPHNDKLLEYWDTVADRLFKIRNSLNLQGVFRQLALFEPPIDPALLAKAAAAGLDIASIVNGLNQPLPLVRFQLLVQKATEIAQEVKSLGNNLLSAMEKEDGEAMAILRAKHEQIVMEMVEQVKYAQLQEAIKSREGLEKSFALVVQRYTYYERQLGTKPDKIVIPELDELDQDILTKMKFSSQEEGIQNSKLNTLQMNIVEDVGFAGGKIISSHENRESVLLEGAQAAADVANLLNTIGSASYIVPNINIKMQPLGTGKEVKLPGGKVFGDIKASSASAAKALSDRLNFEANRAKRIDVFERRQRNWAYQSNLAAGEINQIFKQIRAAEIRQAIAEKELESHRKQMKHVEEIKHFLNEEGNNRKGKKGNKALYTWMKREVKSLYGQCFQFAFDIAKKAERALQHELGKPDLSYLQFGYLSGKEGLLAGEKLYLDIKRMEMAYHDQNQREYELTKHISLLQLDPLALVQLRTTGHCTVELPEAFFDVDGPGHFFRRVKNVAVSIPCVTGPYASVNCTLTLLKSSIRKSPALQEQYARIDAEDRRFSDHFGSLQSIVTSSAQNDSGLFETNLHDERYLPFENSGVISEWQLQLPANPAQGDACQFDYATISDVILHMRYTAREGGKLLRDAAKANFRTQAIGNVRLFSIRHEFPAEWSKLQTAQGKDISYVLNIQLGKNHYPYWTRGQVKTIEELKVFARVAGGLNSLKMYSGTEINEEGKRVLTDQLGEELTVKSLSGLLEASLTNVFTNPVGDIVMHFDKKVLEEHEILDFWLAVKWSKE
ncbi:MAG: Insecticidal toxin complex protein TccB1 [uncultured Thiotrichaceae bacterium]|uniref:Insecticidal toxin complex protein TccB1 n=1 Tax=uncultured Thiotrichaceae bacterium TaxID=298394 RepID=A0A6S6SMN8_9GAMM|nr:MAG: Insecticidal toxin complex protein TccB1 [uncultured Thiotrichaceae bacterium]